MKNIITFLASVSVPLVFVACGSSKDTPAATTTTAWVNTDMQLIVSTSCATASCHGGTQLPSYANISEANMKADVKAKNQVAAGTMPQGGSLTTAQKATFAAFYN